MLDLRLALPDDHLAVGEQPLFVKCVSPKHTDKKRPNMAVYADHLFCYACGYINGCAHPAGTPHGPRCDEFRLSALAALLKVDIETARRVAPQYTSEALDAYRERAATEARRDPLPLALADAYHHLLFQGPRQHRLDWLRARGIDDLSVYDFKLGHDGFRFVIPVFDKDDQLLTLRYRRDDEYGDRRVKYSGLAGRNGFYLFPENKLAGTTSRYVVVCEGELDAVRCWQQGWPAVSATNGARQVPKVIPALQALLPNLKTVVLATDQDEPGEEAAYVAGGIAEASGLRVVRLRWDGAKDITEALQLEVKLRREDYRAGHDDVHAAA